jgi:hypothetical protein
MTLRRGERQKYSQGRPAPVPLRLTQISHELGWGLNSELRGTWAEIDPLSKDTVQLYVIIYMIRKRPIS